MTFRDTFARVDAQLLGRLGDPAELDIAGDGVSLAAVQGEFDAPQMQPHMGQLRTNVLEPRFAVDASVDLAAVVKGTSRLRYSGNWYTVADLIPDSSGITDLVLRPEVA